MSARRLLICLLGMSLASVSARDSLFGRKANKGDFVQPDTSSESEKSSSGDTKTEDPFKDKPSKEPVRHSADSPSEDDKGVIIRPILMDQGWAIKDKMDFQLSRIDKPLAKETSALFRDAWSAFRAQNTLVVEGTAKHFSRLPSTVHELKAKLLQDLGEGRWLVDAEWSNPGHLSWCPLGANTEKAILVIDEGKGSIGDTIATTVVHVGMVQARFDCKVQPAAGQRITIRRHAFAVSPALKDDESTRELFQKTVSAGNPPPEAVILITRDCKTCGGVGYVRRSVPGKIQDARDPCPGSCDRGKANQPVLVTFKP